MSIGIICALAEEAAAFSGLNGVPVACAGLGKVNAAMAVAELAAKGCTMFIVAGTAGKLPGAPEGECFWLAEAVQHDYGASRTNGFATFTAGEWPFGEPSLRPFRAIDDPGCGLPHVRIGTGDSFVENGEQALRLANDLGCQLVDMETAAVAHVAERLGLQWAGIKATTDGADEGSAASFEDNLAAAAKRSAEAVMDLVEKLREG